MQVQVRELRPLDRGVERRDAGVLRGVDAGQRDLERVVDVLQALLHPARVGVGRVEVQPDLVDEHRDARLARVEPAVAARREAQGELAAARDAGPVRGARLVVHVEVVRDLHGRGQAAEDAVRVRALLVGPAVVGPVVRLGEDGGGVRVLQGLLGAERQLGLGRDDAVVRLLRVGRVARDLVGQRGLGRVAALTLAEALAVRVGGGGQAPDDACQDAVPDLLRLTRHGDLLAHLGELVVVDPQARVREVGDLGRGDDLARGVHKRVGRGRRSRKGDGAAEAGRARLDRRGPDPLGRLQRSARQGRGAGVQRVGLGRARGDAPRDAHAVGLGRRREDVLELAVDERRGRRGCRGVGRGQDGAGGILRDHAVVVGRARLRGGVLGHRGRGHGAHERVGGRLEAGLGRAVDVVRGRGAGEHRERPLQLDLSRGLHGGRRDRDVLDAVDRDVRLPETRECSGGMSTPVERFERSETCISICLVGGQNPQSPPG
ncbi:hypothetical protein [Microbacterium lacusdiani]